jgi:hypothetical protein
MTATGDVFNAEIPGQEEDATVFYKIVVADGNVENESVVYNFYVPKIFTGTLTSIYDIQGQQDDSPYEGEVVSTTGVVTGNFGTNYYIQDGYGGWNGLFIYESGRNPSIGDSIIITGKITEYYNKTEMTTISDYYFISANNKLPDPVVVATGGVEEQHEGILVKVKNALCTDDNFPANFGMWTVDDGTGELRIHNTSVFEYEPAQGSYYSVTGPMNYDFDEWKIELRFESDVADGGDTDGPSIVEVTPVVSTNIKLIFNEEVETSSAENTANYTINNGVTVESATQHAFNKLQVNLTVTTLSGDYELTVMNVEDEFGNMMEPQTIPFSYVGMEELFLDGKVNVYPNPASDRLNVTFNSKEDFEVDINITDITGRQIMQKNYAAKQGINKIIYDLNGLGQGIYFLNMLGEQGALNYKLIIR